MADPVNVIDGSLPELRRLIEQRMAVVLHLAESLESSNLALVRNDAEAIARGAAHQAELCRQWSCLEDGLRREVGGGRSAASRGSSSNSGDAEPSAGLQADWEMLSARIRYVTRVHWSLLRHL